MTAEELAERDKARGRTRVTVARSLSHQVFDEPPRGPSWGGTKFQVYCESDEEAYERTVKVAGEWAPLDFGHVGAEGCGIVLIHNPGKQSTGFRQTVELMSRLDSMVLQIGVEAADGSVLEFGFILPGVDLPLFPENASKLRIRCLGGQHKYKVFAIKA